MASDLASDLASDPRIRPAAPDDIDDALERQYNLRIRHPERAAVYERFAVQSARLRAAEPGFAVHRYGDQAGSLLDFFPAAPALTQGRPAPLFVFIHGGYWRALDRSIFSFLARPWLERGVHVALPGYDLAPAASVPDIADQVDTALGWLHARAAPLGIDTARVVISGHSAGAQLGAFALSRAHRWSACGFVGVSGVYDLQPLRATSVNRDIHLDAAGALALSPLYRDVDVSARYLCAVGGAETDGFRGQTQAYVSHLRAHGCAVEALEVPGRTHFDVLDELADADAPLFAGALHLLQST